MAGNKRFAAIIFFGLTALIATGAGAYYLISRGGWTLALTQRNADPPAASPADLDEVASAWAEPAPQRRSSAVHTSAASDNSRVVPAGAEEPLAYEPVGDRYGAAQIPTAAALPEDTAPVAGTPITSAVADATVELQADDGGYDEPLADVAHQVPPHSAYGISAVARGQEPNDEAAATLEVVDAAAEPALAASEVHGIPDPDKPTGVTHASEEPDLMTAAQRARNAFRNQSSATTDDRYGATPNSPQMAAAAASDGIAGPVNPFEAKSPRASQTAAAEGLIETLPSVPENISRLQSAPHREDNFAAPADNATASPSPDGFGASLQKRSIGGESNTAINSEAGAPIGSLPADNHSDAANLDGTGKPGERALEGAQKPALFIQKFAPGEIQVGKPAKFVVQVRNVGVQAADDVVLRDEVPQGTRLISTSPSAQANGNQLVWQLGKLSAGEERSLEMQLMPMAEGEVGSVATVSYSAQASVKTRCTMPQLAIRMTSADKVMIGQEHRVKIELQNPGSGDATGVMLFENVPENVRHASGPALEFEIGTLRAGETRELELVLHAEKAGKVVNVLTARAEGNLQVQQQVEFEVIAPALEVAVSGPERRYLERPATYEVSVENPGTAPAHDVQIITKLPKGMRFVRANNMGEYDAATHAVYWSLAELPEGESGKVELVTMPVETGPQTLEVESRAGQGLTDQAKQQILVEGLAAIMFEVRDLEDPIEVGGETGYEIRVVNQGTKAATNVQIAVHLPPGMQIVSAEGETQHSTRGAALIFDPLPQLLPKADTLYHVRVQGLQAGDQRVNVEVNTDDLAQPIRREESTRVFGDE
jgi:uncharacterized repeat protein (TIGR01451 family)